MIDHDLPMKNISFLLSKASQLFSALKKRKLHYWISGKDFLKAVKEGNTEIIRRYIGSKKNIFVVDSQNGCNCLHYACMGSKNYEEKFQLIFSQENVIEKLINSVADDQMTPLHFACRERCYSIIEKLIQTSGIDINHQNSDGYSPLMFVCGEKYFDMWGKQPFNYSFSKDDYDSYLLSIAKILVTQGANVNIRGNFNETALTLAVGSNIFCLTQFLVSHGADYLPIKKEVSSIFYPDALDIAFREKHVEIFNYLIGLIDNRQTALEAISKYEYFLHNHEELVYQNMLNSLKLVLLKFELSQNLAEKSITFKSPKI